MSDSEADDNDNNIIGGGGGDDGDDQVEIDGTSPSTRRRPFVLLTGTPGVGKTATASLLAVRFLYILAV